MYRQLQMLAAGGKLAKDTSSASPSVRIWSLHRQGCQKGPCRAWIQARGRTRPWDRGRVAKPVIVGMSFPRIFGPRVAGPERSLERIWPCQALNRGATLAVKGPRPWLSAVPGHEGRICLCCSCTVLSRHPSPKPRGEGQTSFVWSWLHPSSLDSRPRDACEVCEGPCHYFSS